jgi:hypothetical protein
MMPGFGTHPFAPQLPLIHGAGVKPLVETKVPHQFPLQLVLVVMVP